MHGSLAGPPKDLLLPNISKPKVQGANRHGMVWVDLEKSIVWHPGALRPEAAADDVVESENSQIVATLR